MLSKKYVLNGSVNDPTILAKTLNGWGLQNLKSDSESMSHEDSEFENWTSFGYFPYIYIIIK